MLCVSVLRPLSRTPSPRDRPMDPSDAADPRFWWSASTCSDPRASLLSFTAGKTERLQSGAPPEVPGGSFMTNMTLFPLQMEEIWYTQAFFHRSEPLVSLRQLLFFFKSLKNEYLESWKVLPPSTCQVCHTEPRREVNKTNEKCEDWRNELETTIQMCRGKNQYGKQLGFFLIFVLLSILYFDIYDYRYVFIYSAFCFFTSLFHPCVLKAF